MVPIQNEMNSGENRRSNTGNLINGSQMPFNGNPQSNWYNMPLNGAVQYGNPMANSSAVCLNPMNYMPNMFAPNMGASNLSPEALMAMVQQQAFHQYQQQQLLNFQFAESYRTATYFAAQSASTTKTGAENMMRRGSTKMKKGKAAGKSKPVIPHPRWSSPTSSDDSDSDCEFEAPKRRKYGASMRPEGIPAKVDFNLGTADSAIGSEVQTTPSGSSEVDTSFSAMDTYQEKLRAFQKGRKHVWQEVAEEEHLQETVNKMDVVTVLDKFVIERGCESYVVGNKRKRKVPDHVNARVNLSEDECSSSYSSFSDGGISDDTKADLHNRLMAKRAAKYASASLKKDFHHEESGLEKGSVEKVKTGQQLLEEKMATLEEYKVPAYLARKLNEEKVELFVRAWRIFGKEYLMGLFRKTLKIERLGGIMIKNKSRRRTPGGVLLYILRNDSRLDKEKREEVFRPLRERIVASRKNDRTLQKLNLFGGIAKRMNGKDSMEAEQLAEAAQQNFEFEEESYAVPTVANLKEGPPSPQAPGPGPMKVSSILTDGRSSFVYDEDIAGYRWNVDITDCTYQKTEM